ncbi:hypothetical protein K3T49_22235 [Paenibacillus sonchi]|nr:hypothetical protein [Paenibacillus sonchi]
MIRKDTNGTRTVRHLSVFKRKSYLHVPAIRLFCTTLSCRIRMDLRIRGAQTTPQQAVSLPCGGASARLNSGA